MKKFVKILIFVILACYNVNPRNFARAADTNTTTYAKALANCNLYKTRNFGDDYESIYFQIPETYFVIILETVNDGCFKVQYDRFVGYVDSSTVVIATFVPIVKTLTGITFDIKSTSGTQIWTYPTATSKIKTTILAGTKNIAYIASIYGSVPTGGESNIWYYVSFVPDSNSTNVYEGYIYSENTTNLAEIVANTETNPEIISEETSDDRTIFFLSSTLKTIIIAIVLVPVILFFAIILYKFIKFLKKKTFLNVKMNNDKNNFNHNEQGTSRFEKYKNLILKRKQKSYLDFPEDDGPDDELL